MAIPELDAFKYEEGWRRWVAPAPDAEFDLAVPDEGGKPSGACFQLLERAVEDLASLKLEAMQYINGFCPTSGIDEAASIVEVSCATERGSVKVRLVLNSQSDLYGLWSVGFHLGEGRGRFPVSFMREAW
jgi:hypothetical protein